MSLESKAIAYYRGSTQKQGQSGLGLDAQKTAVTDYLNKNRTELIAEYAEIESGKRKDRIQLQQAIEHCKRSNALLLIAKLDRLARNVAFISSLLESGVQFVACDMPQANHFTIHILAAVAEHEAKLISQRTRAALTAAKQRGIKLGKPANLTQNARLRGAKNQHNQAVEAYRRVKGYISVLKQQGMSFSQIADRLNNEGYTTRQGKSFTACTAWRAFNYQ